MLRFQHLPYLFVLALLPVLVLLFVYMLYWRRKKIKSLGEEQFILDQIKGYINGRNTLKFILLSIAFALFVIGFANLQTADRTEKVQRKGVDVLFALDVSKSMLAKDVQPDRLTRAKQLIMNIMDKMHNDRVGLVVFAGRSYIQVPLTVDYSAVKMMLQTVSPDLVPAQGTVIGDAIDMSLESFSKQERKYKSLIIISDGEDHDERALQKARDAAETGVTIHTIGVGSPQGATLFDESTKAVKLDDSGNPVISKLNEDELRGLAAAGHGTYNLLQNPEAIAAKLMSELDGMEQKSLGAVLFTDYTSYFQYFLLAGLIALLIEWLIPGARKKSITA
jgi:Ca-activated chloride channel family protein